MPRAAKGKDEPQVKVRLKIFERGEAALKDWKPASYWKDWTLNGSSGQIMEYLLR